MIIYPMKTVKIINLNLPSQVVTVQLCDKFISKLRGLMFKKSIAPYFGLLFTDSSESRLNTAIHMFFMNFDIAVIWLNKDFFVVDKALAKKWRPFYMPNIAAQYTLELHVDRFPEFSVGDQLKVSDEE